MAPKEGKEFSETPMQLINPGLDLWRGEFPLEEPARYVFTVEAWTDRYATWMGNLKKRVEGT